MAKGKNKRKSPPPIVVDPAMQPLDENETLFVAEYLVDRNCAHAYRRLHPEANHQNARRLGWELRHRPNVDAEIQAAINAQRVRKRATADGVIDELARIANSDILDLYDPSTHQLRHPRHIPFETRRVIASMRVSRERTTTTTRGRTRTTVVESTIEYRLWNKLDALGKLANHFGLSTELPPLEVLLRALPHELAQAVRSALAVSVQPHHSRTPLPNGKK